MNSEKRGSKNSTLPRFEVSKIPFNTLLDKIILYVDKEPSFILNPKGGDDEI